MSIYTARTTGGGTDAVGTTLQTFRLGLIGPTIYSGSADPTVTPPTPMDDGFRNGDLYVRTTAGGSAIWVHDTLVWTQIASGSGGGSFAGDIILTSGAQLLGDPAADETAPAFAFDGDTDTGIYQVGADELGFSTGGTQAFIIESDGTLASTIAGYESLVLADNDIPNRRYVEDTFINVAGDTMTGSLTLDTGAQLLADVGSAGSPAISFAADADNGFYRVGADTIGYSAGGAQIASFIADGIRMENGAQFVGAGNTAAAPDFTFFADLDTGVFSDAVGATAISSAGIETIRFSSSSATGSLLWQGGDGAVGTPAISFSGDTDTGWFRTGTGAIAFSSDGSNVLGLTGTLATGSLTWQGGDGTVGSPGISFSSDPDSGIYRVSSDVIGFVAAGTETFRITDTHLQGRDGAIGNPTYSFLSETNTGMYLEGAGLLGFSVVGTERMRLTAIDARFLEPLRGPVASPTTPTFSFTTDEDSGMYSVAANELGFATGSSLRWSINAAGDWLPAASGADIATSGTRMGTVYATTFDGTATAAQYSDLAERYSVGSCCSLKPGDVVIICDHEEHDICKSSKQNDDRVLGVVSTAPGFMMNSEAGDDDTAPYIALRGRVPVKVVGTVKKGDLLVTSNTDGVARAVTADEKSRNVVNSHAVFGKALSSYDSVEATTGNVGSVEAVIL